MIVLCHYFDTCVAEDSSEYDSFFNCIQKVIAVLVDLAIENGPD